jgi:hypothetical protein
MNAVPPKISRTNQWFGLAVVTMVAGGGAAVLFFFNPSTHNFYPTCTFHRLTGLNCPGCGMTRALYALLHGDLTTALRDNALLVIGLAVFAVRGFWLAANEFRGRPGGVWFPGKWFWPLLVIALVFAVLRNLPAFSFLSPA